MLRFLKRTRQQTRNWSRCIRLNYWIYSRIKLRRSILVMAKSRNSTVRPPILFAWFTRRSELHNAWRRISVLRRGAEPSDFLWRMLQSTWSPGIPFSRIQRFYTARRQVCTYSWRRAIYKSYITNLSWEHFIVVDRSRLTEGQCIELAGHLTV